MIYRHIDDAGPSSKLSNSNYLDICCAKPSANCLKRQISIKCGYLIGFLDELRTDTMTINRDHCASQLVLKQNSRLLIELLGVSV
ncbi:hypothetical protein BpHYR1_031172 [Brachionus plicatilis]|uniref:Uncharacterized protein n=1 Tax=Brachionus plicatilis TaxID=10195 RepID=A0A3M7PCM4_BRAPC|nr:hypothetical protein BpHYR1_031172 [Brachionus plicatilis]